MRLRKPGAQVTHVDAAKNMVERCKSNAQLSDCPSDGIRYIVDDCNKFVAREIKRGNTYDAVLMDPPSYGRGPNGEMWKLEDSICSLVEMTVKVLSDKPLFFLINSYTTGRNLRCSEIYLIFIFPKATCRHMKSRFRRTTKSQTAVRLLGIYGRAATA